MNFRFLALAPLAALAAITPAQSFNLDLDEGAPREGGGGAPSSSFGAAAGQAGFWNAIPAIGPVVPLQLRGLDGALTSVTFVETGGVAMSHAINYAPNTGDYASLLNDFASIGASGTSFYTLNNLNPGEYIVYSYAVFAFTTSGLVHVQVTGGMEGVVDVTGPMPGNSFAPGITHSVHHLHLTGSTLSIALSSTSNLGATNGFQIIAVPEPGSFALISAGALYLLRRRPKS